MADAWTALQRRKRTAGAQPLVTFLDSTKGERTELSATSLENAAAKIANALRNEFDAQPGTTVALHLPQHWQRSAWSAGAWFAGCIVAPFAEEAELFVATADLAPQLVDSSREVAVVSTHPFGLPITDALPRGAFDVTVAVRSEPDAYLFDRPEPDYAALVVEGKELSQDEAFTAAGARANDWGLAASGILLATGELSALDAWLCAFAVPLAAEASVLLLSGDADAAVQASERVTAVAE